MEEEEDETPVILLDKSNELVLSVPFSIYNKTCRISSDVVRRPDVFLQIMVWQHGSELGIVAFDPVLHDVYFVQSSASQQEILCDELEPADVTEMSINMSIFMMSLIYTEKEYDLETGEEIDVSLRIVEQDSESDDDSADEVWDDEEEKAERKEKKRLREKAKKEKKVKEAAEYVKTRVQGFLTLAEDMPEENEFPSEEAHTEESADMVGEENFETGEKYGDDDDSIDFSQ